MTYKIVTRTLQGSIVTFHVDSYEVIDGFVCFTDEKTQLERKFFQANCEITEVKPRDD